jgi:hypothetical protein
LVAHSAQRFCTHAGVEVPAQSALTAHCTHFRVVGSQTLCEVGQSAAEKQPTHASVAVSQNCEPLSPGHSRLFEQAARHVWVPGQQLGVFAPHWLFDTHCTQMPFTQ